MALGPQLPLQAGANLASLGQDMNTEDDVLSDKDVEDYADALGLDDDMNLQEDVISRKMVLL